MPRPATVGIDATERCIHPARTGRPTLQQAIEHLQAIAAALFQHQRQVMVLQGVGIQVQRAVLAALLAQATQYRVMIGQGGQGDLSRLQFQYMGVLRHLQQVAMVEPLLEQQLSGVEDFLDPQGDGLGAIATEAAHP